MLHSEDVTSEAPMATRVHCYISHPPLPSLPSSQKSLQSGCIRVANLSVNFAKVCTFDQDPASKPEPMTEAFVSFATALAVAWLLDDEAALLNQS